MEQPYQPVNCEFHDVLEATATRRRTAAVVFVDAQGTRQEVSDRIADIVTRDGAEFVVLGDGTAVRLDRIVSVDGVALAGFPAS